MDSEFITARALDCARLAELNSSFKFLGFLSESEAARVRAVLKSADCSVGFFGGYENAERTVLCCCPENCEPAGYPVTPVTFRFRICDKLSHRDFLGALTALNIAREKIGDILIECGRAVVFLHKDIADYAVMNIGKVGSVGVKAEKGLSEPLPEMKKPVLIRATVSSLRLDCVISELAKVSRKEAAELIESGYVLLNSMPASKATVKLSAGDTVSVRKKGKFKIISDEGLSKKGKTVINYEKYI